MKAAIYARFSSDKQTDRSIEDQVALCRDICEREGLMIVGVYDDRAISGASTLNRMGWQRLMRDAKGAKFDVVVAEALDRISRDQEDLAGIHKRLRFAGIEIRTAQDGIAGDIHIGVKGLLGSLYLKDLAQKTRRGQAGVNRDGRHNGGRSYGYRPIPGKAGELEIDVAEAAVVRTIFADYLDARSPRDIAAALNKKTLPGPRGGAWNASTIGGSRKRMNGILQNELYVGRIVWNRQSFIKDPETGKRISRENPREEWMTAQAEHLRIVDDDIWARVQARRTKRGGPQTKRLATRPKNLLSGLVKCGRCGSGYIVGGHDKRGSLLLCSRMKETGLCDNKRMVPRATVEAIVLEGIEEKLAAPEVIAEYVREYHRITRELHGTSAHRRRDLEKRLGNVNGAITKAVDAILAEAPSRALRDRLTALEAERDQLEAEIANIVPPTVEFHPNAANAYRDKVRDLKQTLASADEDSRLAAHEAIREIVEKIVIHPRERYKPVEIEIYRQLAALLRISERAAGPQESGGVLVAGTCNHLKLLFEAVA
ncbi:recombinase family protein [Bradyrhizobium sp. 33ap4]|uniref:recombinase family protein n=1 Tax=Bradyrhizobium sp. 33ap4 TaxID=3061630 RepID=UPI00293114CF|nr:recombinase family protein [Bradyrhizobium sp. 33ap4]